MGGKTGEEKKKNMEIMEEKTEEERKTLKEGDLMEGST